MAGQEIPSCMMGFSNVLVVRCSLRYQDAASITPTTTYGLLADAAWGQTGLVGYVADIRKLFDSVDPNQAITTAVHLGLCDDLAELLRNFIALSCAI